MLKLLLHLEYCNRARKGSSRHPRYIYLLVMMNIEVFMVKDWDPMMMKISQCLTALKVHLVILYLKMFQAVIPKFLKKFYKDTLTPRRFHVQQLPSVSISGFAKSNHCSLQKDMTLFLKEMRRFLKLVFQIVLMLSASFQN